MTDLQTYTEYHESREYLRSQADTTPQCKCGSTADITDTFECKSCGERFCQDCESEIEGVCKTCRAVDKENGNG